MPPGSDVPLLVWPEAAALGAAVAVTTRHGGISDGPYATLNLGLHVGDRDERVVANRARAAHAFGTELDTLIFAEQVHGVGCTTVVPADRGRGTRAMADAVGQTDALVTASAATVLAILVADCVPIALIDPEARVLAAVHAGWRGTGAGVVARAVDAMTRLGGRADRIWAYLGPAVHADRYQVDEPVRQALAAAVAPDPLPAAVIRADGTGHWLVDLVAANRQHLVRVGIPEDQIHHSGTTTADDDFFSDRAARPCGRFGLLAQLVN